MTDPVTIGYGVNKWVKDANTEIKTLYYRNFYSAGTAYTLHESGGSTDYQVPAGKKFIILSIETPTDKTTGSHDCDVWESTTINSASGTKVYEFWATANSANLQSQVYIEISASKYINCVLGTSIGITMIGIETNA
jgi:hypothetical protein